MTSPRTTGAATRSQLVELAVTDFGIIRQVRLLIGPGMTALTGETGAGKTLLVGAIDLLLGGRADPSMVRHGCDEAVIEGRFLVEGEELVLSRVIPADGRSRAYVDGRMATAAVVGEHAAELIDLHGQHAHQSLLAASVQRAALDQFGGIDLEPLQAARAERKRIAAALHDLGGDAGARAREADLLRFQVHEIDSAALADPDEDQALDALEDTLADSVAHRQAASAAVQAISDDGGAVDAVGLAVAAVDGRMPFEALAARLHAAQAELLDVAADLRSVGEGIDDDPGRLAEIRDRRQLLVELRRKYGTAPHAAEPSGGQGRLADVIGYHETASARLAEIDSHDARAAQLDDEARAAARAEAKAAGAVAAARRASAAPLGKAVEANLGQLAMASARFLVAVGDDDPGDDVTFLLAANPGADPGPLAKVASGGELARSMLALRLVLSVAPPVLVFDEVDAGIGGQAALAVGRALAALGADHQVLVVTHLPQVAAFADAQVNIRKEVAKGTTVASATPLDDADRVIELSRMLSGTPESERVREAAHELLDLAATERGR
ncbi:DNA repair protein RecN [Aquihabitans sp. McL0605]|uniref:DNA repair protein RecN n=1 Tax=Aquihabitans sp. McL0605 TaxID=3415671 RepID=UPI003CED0E56